MTNVLIVAPIRKRLWVLPDYTSALQALHIPDSVSVDFMFLLNDLPEENTKHEAILDVLNPYYMYMDYLSLPYTYRDYEQLAIMRNALLDMARSADYDYLMSVDSDIILPPEALIDLLRVDAPMVSALVNNRPGDWYPNAGSLGDNRWMPRYDIKPHTGLYAVQVTGAASLMARTAFIGHYAPHKWSEDIPYCLDLEASGMSRILNSDVYAEHRMSNGGRKHES